MSYWDFMRGNKMSGYDENTTTCACLKTTRTTLLQSDSDGWIGECCKKVGWDYLQHPQGHMVTKSPRDNIDWIMADDEGRKTIPRYVEESAWQSQKGGTHYKDMPIQPFEYSMANGLDPMQHTVIKYVSRFRDKNGIEDLEKARHTIDLLIDWEKKRISNS